MTTNIKDVQAHCVDLQNAEDIPEEELAVDWTLTPQEVIFSLNQCHGESANYLRFATQLCWLRKTGRFIQDYSLVPIKVVQYLSRQLECEPVLFISQPERHATESRYHQLIRE